MNVPTMSKTEAAKKRAIKAKSVVYDYFFNKKQSPKEIVYITNYPSAFVYSCIREMKPTKEQELSIMLENYEKFKSANS